MKPRMRPWSSIPATRSQSILALIAKHKLQVKQIVITHAHIDHVGGAMKLRAATGAPILLNQNDYALLKMLECRQPGLACAVPAKLTSIKAWDRRTR